MTNRSLPQRSWTNKELIEELSKAPSNAQVLISVNEWHGPSPWSDVFGVHVDDKSVCVTLCVEVMA